MASTDARPVPRKNTACRVYFPILDADGDLVAGATGLDSEVSIDGAAFGDCTNEATEIGSSGTYYLDLTSGEMNGDGIVVVVKTSSSGAKSTVLTFYPEEAGDYRVDVVQISGDATAADNLEAYSDGTTPQPVNVTQFGGTNLTATGGRPEVNTTHIAGSSVSTSSAQIGVNVVNAGGTAWGSGAITAGSIAADAITAAKIATGAIDADAIADNAIDAGAIASGAITSAKFAAGAITASVIATDAIDADAIAADAVTEIQSGLSTLSAADVRSAVGLASANLDTQLSTIDTVVDSILVDSAEIGAAGAGLSAIPWNAAWDAEVESEAADALAAYDPPTKAELDAAVDALPTALENADAILTRQMSESYAGDGVAPTIAQALFLIQQQLGDFSISGTTLTVKKLDGTATAATFTLDSGTSPTALARSG